MSSLSGQVGGDHYKKMAMQPFEFSLRNGWDSAAHSILKYVARHGDKGGKEDLYKAIHICDIRCEFFNSGFNALGIIGMLGSQPVIMAAQGNPNMLKPVQISNFLNANKIGAPEGDALVHLERWVEAGMIPHGAPGWTPPAPIRTHEDFCALVKNDIREIIKIRYERHGK